MTPITLTADVVIAEGLMALYDTSTNALYDTCFFIEISKAAFLKRKAEDLRWGREPDWYLEHIWESFQRYGQPGPGLPGWMALNGEKGLNWPEVLDFLKG